MTSDTSETSAKVSATINEILDYLYEKKGNKITMHFGDEASRELSRVRIYQVKAKKEAELISIGFMEPSEVMSLQAKKSTLTFTEGSILYVLSLTLIEKISTAEPLYSVIME